MSQVKNRKQLHPLAAQSGGVLYPLMSLRQRNDFLSKSASLSLPALHILVPLLHRSARPWTIVGEALVTPNSMTWIVSERYNLLFYCSLREPKSGTGLSYPPISGLAGPLPRAKKLGA